ncbi:YaiI/YqxD family protein [Vibrio sp. SCSIO 43136]|uniref:YaiI/YqxD family protein n=1 Tax=Vibrio sp. SCSIO 43136 TaxID=2819101 RepID=UPI002075EF28|nr:YaiI/YqxD family protein [Vibrio sp. SCSIO 43136]USD64723.1 YaiI/YqxD family protein [Vibrio sp. SCSIO 43136]
MKIYVDADACPVAIREMIVRAAHRTQTDTLFVANQFLRLAPSPYVKMQQVQSGFDVADNEIVQKVEAGDLVITSDIPLASEVIDKGALALSSRGELFTTENIKSRLNMRDFLETMRSSGVQTGGPAPLGQADKQNFANQLDRWLAKKR